MRMLRLEALVDQGETHADWRPERVSLRSWQVVRYRKVGGQHVRVAYSGYGHAVCHPKALVFVSLTGSPEELAETERQAQKLADELNALRPEPTRLRQCPHCGKAS